MTDAAKAMQFFRLLHVNQSRAFIWRMYDAGDGEQFLKQSQQRVSRVYTRYMDRKNCKRWMTNVYFAVNQPAIEQDTFSFNGFAKTKFYEQRKAERVEAFNSFFLDFDIHGTNETKHDVAKIIKTLPLRPTAIVETRNGFHVYFAIPEKERTMKLETWRKTENQIFEYCHRLTETTDSKCKDAARILRIPYSYHRKPENKDLFQVTIRYICKKNVYSIDELQKAFTLQSVNTVPAPKQKIITTIPKKKISNSKRIYDIKTLTKFEIVPAQDTKRVKTINDAITFFKHEDMISFLGIDVQEGDCFKSLLRADKKPSCTIARNRETNDYTYYDYGTGQMLNIIQMVQEIANCDSKTAISYLLKLYHIQIEESISIDAVVEKNLSAFEQLCKEYRYLEKAINTYHEIMQIWKERATEYNVKSGKFDLMLGSQYIADRLKAIGIKASQQQVSKQLAVLEYIGALKQVESVDKRENGKKKTNTYRIMQLDTIRNIEERAGRIEQEYKNVWRDITVTNLAMMY